MQIKNPIRVFSLTINSSHPTENRLIPINELEIILQKECKAYVFSLEKGEKGRFHYQSIVHLRDRTRNPSRLFVKQIGKDNIPLWEFSPCSNIRSLTTYVGKSPLGEVCRFSQLAVAKPIFDHIELRHAQLAMSEILEKEANDRSIFIFSSQGGLGKSTYIKWLHMQTGIGCVYAPSTGTIDSQAASITRQLYTYNIDPGIQKIYLTFDITRTSPYLKNQDRKIALLSLCEHAVTGLLSCAFQGSTRSYFAKSGKCVPVIFTNAHPNQFEGLISVDREYFYTYDYKKKSWERY